MANDIYVTAHTALSELVSVRAASRVLDSALKQKGKTPGSVSAADMRELLRGPVFRELEAILPREGLKLKLKKLSRELRKLEAAEADAAPERENEVDGASGADPTGKTTESVMTRSILGEAGAEATSVQTALKPVATWQPPSTPTVSAARAEHPALDVSLDEQGSAEPHTEVILAEPEFSAAEAGDVEAAAGEAGTVETDLAPADDTLPVEDDLLVADSALTEDAALDLEPDVEKRDVAEPSAPGSASASPDIIPASPSEAPTERTLDAGAIEGVVLEIAKLEHLKFVAALRGGQIVFARGGGFDADALSRLGTMGLKLLERSGKLRSYYLAHTDGQLFFFPLGPYILSIVGTTKLNMGLVFTALQQLKEDG